MPINVIMLTTYGIISLLLKTVIYTIVIYINKVRYFFVFVYIIVYPIVIKLSQTYTVLCESQFN